MRILVPLAAVALLSGCAATSTQTTVTSTPALSTSSPPLPSDSTTAPDTFAAPDTSTTPATSLAMSTSPSRTKTPTPRPTLRASATKTTTAAGVAPVEYPPSGSPYRRGEFCPLADENDHLTYTALTCVFRSGHWRWE